MASTIDRVGFTLTVFLFGLTVVCNEERALVILPLFMRAASLRDRLMNSDISHVKLMIGAQRSDALRGHVHRVVDDVVCGCEAWRALT